ncbi:UDP-N-acetylglucosamine--N-acetylmuramyl-(pentapeptide) pyrophosphoryl-undecaprenol N-acetylglucosamine transferase [Methanobacterium sp. ACI-7]|uniref:UDP-N-acetylglucosamine--N-acetylmuramyl- (pentapeptide) pyrophosphoryl-undecaprenol N-acetylglucosamine transferase n=1 Tax=unclassified Methanobacterium TaxID=2627676 RepID=UPI0039C3E433
MKILMIPCGIGIGHTSRCIALAQELQKRGAEVVFASYGSGYKMLKTQGKYKTAKLPDIKFYGDDGGFNIKHTAKKSVDMPFTFLKSIYQESKIIKKFKPDIIVADAHYSVPITAKILGIPCILVTNELALNFSNLYLEEKTVQYLENGLKKFITDVVKKCDVVLIPDIEKSIEVPSKLRETTIFTGPFLKQNINEIMDKNKLRTKMEFKDDDRIVLVTVGGSDFGKRLLRCVYEASEKIECDKLIMITGPQIDSNFIPTSDKIIKKEFLENIMEWMKLSDLIISLAGHTTTMEIASLGIPSIIVPIENHSEQLKNASTIESYGISYVRQINQINSYSLADDINRILEDQDLMKKIEIIKKEFLKYIGTQKAADIIFKIAE